MRLWVTLLVLAAVVVCRPDSASADLITIEPDAFAPGTDVTHASPGVTLWTITARDPLMVMFTPTYVKQNPKCLTSFPCEDAVTGAQGFSPEPDGYGSLFAEYGEAPAVDQCLHDAYFGAYASGPFDPCTFFNGYPALWMEFDTGADFVELAGVWGSDYLWMKAYDENYQTVDLQDVREIVLPKDPHAYNKGFSNVAAPAGNIKYVIAGSVGGRAGIDTIRYSVVSTVPEPSTLLLCGVGVVGLLRSRHRSRR